jgi:hypothetical protein
MKTYYVEQFVKITHKVQANGPAEAMEIVRASDSQYAIEYDTQEYIVEEAKDDSNETT